MDERETGGKSMKRKQRQRWIAMLMAVVMLSGTIGSAGLAQTPETERGTVQESGAAAGEGKTAGSVAAA